MGVPVASSLLEGGARGRYQLVVLDLSEVDPPGERLRFGLNESKVDELVLSIASEGLLSPAGVRRVGDRYQVVWGDHRTEALRRLGWPRAEFFLVAADDDMAVVLSATENLQRHDMSPVEEAGLCSRLFDVLGQDVDEVVRRLHRTRAWVESRLRMMVWPADVQWAVHTGALSMAAGSELALVTNDEHRRFLLGHAVDGGATARTCQGWRISWEVSGTVSTAAVEQVRPGCDPPAPVEAELPCYWHGDRESYGDLTHIWMCARGLSEMVALRDGRPRVPGRSP